MGKFWSPYLGKVTAATRAVLPIAASMCSICVCANIGMAARAWHFNVRTDVNACDFTWGLYRHCKRVGLHWKLTGRKIPCCTREWNPCQQHAGLTHCTHWATSLPSFFSYFSFVHHTFPYLSLCLSDIHPIRNHWCGGLIQIMTTSVSLICFFLSPLSFCLFSSSPLSLLPPPPLHTHTHPVIHSHSDNIHFLMVIVMVVATTGSDSCIDDHDFVFCQVRWSDKQSWKQISWYCWCCRNIQVILIMMMCFVRLWNKLS